MPSRVLDFEVFDADNHMYETAEALTKFLPNEYKGAIDYVDVHGRTKLAVRGQITEYIPNPTFSVVASPGAQEEYFKIGNPEGKSHKEIMKPMKAIAAYREPAPRIELMDELGIDRAMMYPTLGSLIEERMRDDPDLCHVTVHALNQWMLEQWSFNYENRIFATPVITPPIVEKAVEELEWALSNGAKAVLMRPAPAWGLRGPRSFALPEFDPFWKLLEESGILLVIHSSDSGYQRHDNEWEGTKGEFLPFAGGSKFGLLTDHFRPIADMVASLIGHGALFRFPKVKIAIVENGSGWVRPTVERLQSAYERTPKGAWPDDPMVAFRRSIYVHPFHEENPVGLTKLVGVENVLFGSDYPHPEGMSDPIAYVDELTGLPKEDVAKIMGGNLASLMGVSLAA
jgi:predicted TIM-barrel fold metal-dependent hydrolase